MTAHDDGKRGDDIHGDAVRPDGTHGQGPCDDRTYEDRPPEDRVDADGGFQAGHDQTARDAAGHGGALRHGSADPLMAAILAEAPSEDDRRDPAFMAEHEAAVADLAVLREQLAFLGEALAAPSDAVAEPSDAVPDTGTGDGAAAGNAENTVAEDTVPVGPAPTPTRPAGLSTPAGPGGSTGPGRSRVPRGSRGPGRGDGPGRRRRSLRVALGTLAVAAAATVVTGLGWLVVQPGAGQETSSADAGAPAAGRDDAGAGEDGAKSERADERAPIGDPRWLACARLVAEGVVTATRPVPGSEEQRITLTVTRVHAGEEATTVTFLHGTAGSSAPAVGDRLLVGLPREGDRPDLVVTGVQNIALTRTWITSALPEANRLACE
ncbi:hypothetical protein [Streptomyces sp. enrichment culture]|uniref:hypothetical protein n=1 Tax=Streptomyces sp. enrichment culture TaxID=1795815 RepID=UPI003F577457